MFNLRLTPARIQGSDVVLGFDMDGFTLSGHIHPFACYIHGVLADEAAFERGSVARLLRLQARAERRSARQADLVLTTSKYSAHRIAAAYGVDAARIGIVPPAFDVVRRQLDLERLNERHDMDRSPTVLCVARMYPRKNIRSLIGATRLLVDRGLALRVRIVGDGPERRELERVTHALDLTETVMFTGQIPHTDLLTEFARAEVFCLPSLQEGFGIAFLEAMAAGQAVVAVWASSTPELIEDGVNGLLARPHDESDLADKLGLVLEDAALRKQMAAANRVKAMDYDLATTTTRMLDLLRRIT
jgi:glycosyltransferase involved in cell wall biosynthesis